MAVILLDRDGVVIVNRATNVKSPSDLELLPGVAEAIARLNGAGFDVAICTNQPEVARGVLTQEQLDCVHEALKRMLASRNAKVDMILCCGYDHKWRRWLITMWRRPTRRLSATRATTSRPPSTPGANACSCAPGLEARRWQEDFRSIFHRSQFTTTWPPWSVRSWRESSRFEADVVSRPALGRALFGLPIAQRCRPC
jgi:histidinol-phosphate phosphatase family protein